MIPAINREQIYGWRSPSGRVTRVLVDAQDEYLPRVMQRAARKGYVFALIPVWMCWLRGRYHQTGHSAHWVVCAVRPQQGGYHDTFAGGLRERRSGSQGVHSIDVVQRARGRRRALQTKYFGHPLFAWTWYFDQAERWILRWDRDYSFRLHLVPRQADSWFWRNSDNLNRLIRDYNYQIQDGRRLIETAQSNIARWVPELANYRAQRRRESTAPPTLTPEMRASIMSIPDVRSVALVSEGLEVVYYPTICRRVRRGRPAHDCNFDVLVPALTFLWQSGNPLPYDLSGTSCHPHRGCFGDYTPGMDRAFQTGDLLGSVLAVAQWRKTHGAGSYTLPPLDCVRLWFERERQVSPSVFELEDNGTIRTVDISCWLPKPLWCPTLDFNGVPIIATERSRVMVSGAVIEYPYWVHMLNVAFTPWAPEVLLGRASRGLAQDMHAAASIAAREVARRIAPVTTAEHRHLHNGRYWHNHLNMRSDAAASRDEEFHQRLWLSCGRALSTGEWATMRAEIGGQPRPSVAVQEPPAQTQGLRQPAVNTDLRWPHAFEEAEHNILHLSDVPHLHARIMGHDDRQTLNHGAWGGPTAADWSVIQQPELQPEHEDEDSDPDEEEGERLGQVAARVQTVTGRIIYTMPPAT